MNTNGQSYGTTPSTGTSNGKAVYAMYFGTQAGVVPYKLYRVDDDEDVKRIPVPVIAPITVSDSQRVTYSGIQTETIGAVIYANFSAQTMTRNAALYTTAGLGACVGAAILNNMLGAQ